MVVLEVSGGFAKGLMLNVISWNLEALVFLWEYFLRDDAGSLLYSSSFSDFEISLVELAELLLANDACGLV